MRVETVHYNGGFGRAGALTPADILSPQGEARALIEAEDDLLEEINAAEGAFASRLAPGDDPGRRVWRAVGLDAEGLDLSAGALVARVDFSGPAADPADWRRRLEEALAGRGA